MLTYCAASWVHFQGNSEKETIIISYEESVVSIKLLDSEPAICFLVADY